ncbi:MAG: cyclic nucleotide-binding domain-containing protein [Candidatus Marinimicrobia bacterium]|nr:cyclic nucleotide-binding domain-containing protein [Candidatus Neomarinimicrobiota bacterium]
MKNALWEKIFRGKSKEVSQEVLTLKKVPVFEGLEPKELSEIEKLIHHRTYKPDEVVFRRNAPGEGMYIILRGKVDILTESGEGTSSVVASLKEGDFFGDLSLLDKEPRSATALAKDHTTLLGFFRPDLTALLKRKPQLGVKILMNLAAVIGERLRKTNDLLSQMQSKNISATDT